MHACKMHACKLIRWTMRDARLCESASYLTAEVACRCMEMVCPEHQASEVASLKHSRVHLIGGHLMSGYLIGVQGLGASDCKRKTKERHPLTDSITVNNQRHLTRPHAS
jgi:hypothetical protein